MKKQTIQTTCCLGLMAGVSLIVTIGVVAPPTRGEVFRSNMYEGTTTFGRLAMVTDAAGIGQVLDFEMSFEYGEDYRGGTFGYSSIRVDHAFIGCTNGQIIRVYRFPTDQGYYPDVGSNIVFAATTNNTYMSGREWDGPYESLEGSPYVEEQFVPEEYRPIYKLMYGRRSWWYLEDPAGELPLQFLTNAIQIVRIERNWTNYYHLVRDGHTSTSPRVKNDVRYELTGLIRSAPDDAHLEFMRDDPLFPDSRRQFLDAEITKRAQP